MYIENKKSNLWLINNLMFYSLACLVLLPSVTFGIVDAEIFPWGLIFYVVYGKSINRNLFIFIGGIFCSGAIVSYMQNSIVSAEVLRSFFAYVNTLLIFNLIQTSSSSVIYKWRKLVRLLFLFFIIIGVIQHLGILKSSDFLIKLFIPRGYTYSLSFMGGRGVTLLSSEPARAGIELIFLYLVVRTVFIKKGNRLFCDLAILVFTAIVIKSAIALLFYFLVLIVLYRSKAILVGVIFSPLMFLFVNSGQGVDSRAITLIIDIFSKNDFAGLSNIFINTGGHRVVSIYTSYLYSIFNPLGGGVGNWQTSSIDSIIQAGINPKNIQYFIVHGEGEAVGFRASGFVSNLALDIGLVGLSFFSMYMYKSLRKFWIICATNKEIIIIFLFKICFIGSVGNPVSWVCLVLSLHFKTRVDAAITNGILYEKK